MLARIGGTRSSMSSKISLSDLAAAALDGVEAGAAEVLAEQGSRDVKARPPLKVQCRNGPRPGGETAAWQGEKSPLGRGFARPRPFARY